MLKVILLCLLFQSIYANDALEDMINAENKKITILCFYTTWCPACKKSIDMLNDLNSGHNGKVRIIGVDLDDVVKRKVFIKRSEISFPVIAQTLSQAAQYGVKDFVPTIIVLNEKHLIVKRFHQTPDRRYFFRLIQRLSSGYLENGTLPIEQRVDLWKNKRE